MQHTDRGYALALLGRTADGASEGTPALELTKDFEARGRVLRWLSCTYAVAEDEERAISTTEQALKSETFIRPAWLRIDPHYASMRNDPRFQALMR